METTRITIDVPTEMKVKLQLIVARKRKKMSPEIKRLLDTYIKRNDKVLQMAFTEDEV